MHSARFAVRTKIKIMNDKNWITTPVLPCKAIGETLLFWENLGFRTTYRQDRPYQYGVVERGGHELHFVRVKGTEAGYTGCLIMVRDVAEVHTAFCASLKKQLGRVPLTGIPRISRMKPGQSRFTITDVSGNGVICIQIGELDQTAYETTDQTAVTALQKVMALALRLRDFKEDHLAAAKVLDTAFGKLEDGASVSDQAEALVIRSELARVLEEPDRQTECETLIAGLGIADDDLQQLRQKHCWGE